MRRAKRGGTSIKKIINSTKDNDQMAVGSDGNSSNVPDDSDDSQENAKATFDVELRWCIDKLQLLLSSSSLSSKQVEIKGKALNILNDSKAPIIKKRSVMRNSLGDYRTQMKEEEQKYIKESKNMKVIPVAACNQKGTYIRKCQRNTTSDAQPNLFRFNFPSSDVSLSSP